MEALELADLIQHFADALAEVDRSGVRHKSFRPGIGPFGESEAVREALVRMRSAHPDVYGDAAIKRSPDLLIPSRWALEMKLLRPFGDNGKLAEHWSENVLHPYSGNTSSLGDCLKLLDLDLPVRGAVVILGFEHSPPLVSLEPAMRAFELIAAEVLGIHLGPRLTTARANLIHPVHQSLRVFAYEVLGRVQGLNHPAAARG